MAPRSEVTLTNVVLERLLEVADYQRPFAWEVKQLTDLWEDIDLMGSGRHYAGTLVLKEIPVLKAQQVSSDGEVLTPFEVVDGQQRLTTCLLLLDRVRRQFERLAVDGIEGAAKTATRLADVYGTLTVDKVRRARLRLAGDLGDYFRDSVLGDEPVTSTTMVAGQRRLDAAAKFFDSRLAQLVEGVPGDVAAGRLQDLQARVTSGLRFLVYEVESDAEVGVIFETLNERGRPLTELEKVKNYLLYLARQLPESQSSDLAVYINRQWSEIFQRLSRLPAANEERLLRAHWLCAYDPDSRKWAGTQSIKARFPRSRYVPGSARLSQQSEHSEPDEDTWNVLYEEVRDYVSGLAACATFLAEMNDPKAEYHAFSTSKDRVHLATGALLRSPVQAMFLPVAFAYRLRHPNDGDGYADLIELCEKYSARVFAICQRRGNAGEPSLNRIAYEIYSGADTSACFDKIVALLVYFAPDDVVEQNLLGTYNWYDRQAHKYVLYEYERSFAKSDMDVVAWDDINAAGSRKTTEHILPQTPDELSQWCKDFSEEEQQTLRHTLGNLVLTHDNSVYGRKDYKDKRGVPGQTTPACYFTASLRSESDVARRFEVWTPKSIATRQLEIGTWALGRWKVQQPSPAMIHAVDDDVNDQYEPDGGGEEPDGD